MAASQFHRRKSLQINHRPTKPPPPASSLGIVGSRNETALKFTKTGGRSGIRPWPSLTREPCPWTVSANQSG